MRIRQSTDLPPLALCYHGVADVPWPRDRSRLFVSPRALEGHISALVHWGYRLVTFGELAQAVAAGEGPGLAALTFDDGFVDILSNLVPLLKRAHLPATVFIVSDWLGRAHPDAPWSRAMTSEELRALASAGVEVGGHSTTHRRLGALPSDEAMGDMRKCRIDLEEIIDRPVHCFAYPYGDASPATMEACAAAGYTAACRSAGAGRWDEPFNLPRQDMYNGDTIFDLWLKRQGRYERVMRTSAGLAFRRASRLVQALRP